MAKKKKKGTLLVQIRFRTSSPGFNGTKFRITKKGKKKVVYNDLQWHSPGHVTNFYRPPIKLKPGNYIIETQSTKGQPRSANQNVRVTIQKNETTRTQIVITDIGK